MGKIIWLASFPKSGNTWLRAFLHNLLRNPKDAYDINQLTHFTRSDAQMRWFNLFDPRRGEEIGEPDIAALRPKVHEAITKSSPDSVFVKTHNALVEDLGVPLVSMAHTAGAIYVVRNPLDVVVSYAHHYGVTIDEAIQSMNTPGLRTKNTPVVCYELFGSWSEHVRSWTGRPSPGLHVVRYEDMLDRPLKSFGDVVAFLGLKVPRERLDRAIGLSSFRVLQEQERQRGFVERHKKSQAFFRQGRAGEWQELLSSAQVEAVTAVHQEQMARFGYWPLPGI